MTQQELTDSLAEAAVGTSTTFVGNDTVGVELVELTLSVEKAHWEEALTNGTQAKVLVTWLENQRTS
tara:strand:- start:3474 stop:3674 length:201 start_codon:yes stop_codon:yes gene_type:complete